MANVKTLGFGSRLGVWVQGCTIGCKGCCTVESWDSGLGKKLSVDAVIAWTQTHLKACDGLTLSGGEPSEQPQAVLELIRAFKQHWRDSDVLLYSGRSYRYLLKNHRELTESCDILICGPFVQNRPTLALRGSDNQTIHLQTKLAQQRYGDLSDHQNGRQFHIGKNGALAVGIAEKMRIREIITEENHHG